MEFVSIPENNKLTELGIALQYQYNQCKSIILTKTDYPEIYNKENDTYYNDKADDNNQTLRVIKDIIKVDDKSGRVSSMFKDYIILVPCTDFKNMLTFWEEARIKTILKYGSFIV